MIDWGTTPHGTTAQIFLPAASADEILRLASQRYLTHRLTKVDQFTVQMPTDGLAWLPIPGAAVAGASLAGLLTVDFPGTVRKGDVHTIVIRQVSTVGRSEKLEEPASGAVAQRSWRRVVGSFAMVVPVSTSAALLPGAERKLSLMRWIGEAIPAQSRWWPVFHRYLDQLTAGVKALGGDPTTIPATGTGSWPGWIGHLPGKRHRHEDRAHAGKVIGLRYDRFGDFEGFVLENYEGERRRYWSRERRIERIARRAWIDRLVLVVFTDEDEDGVAGLELRGSPGRYRF